MVDELFEKLDVDLDLLVLRVEISGHLLHSRFPLQQMLHLVEAVPEHRYLRGQLQEKSQHLIYGRIIKKCGRLPLGCRGNFTVCVFI